MKYRQNPAVKLYAKAIKDINLNKQPKQPVNNKGGLLRRNPSMLEEVNKSSNEPYDQVLDALKQVQEQRRKLF